MSDDIPLVTFLLVAQNEEAYIGRALRSALEQDYPQGRLEILVVVDPATTDGTQRIAEERAAAVGADRVRVVRGPRSSLAEGWNEGIRQARGQYVIRIDVHGDAPVDFVRRSVQAAPAAGDKVIVGCTCVSREAEAAGDPAWRRAVFLAETSLFGSSASSFRREVTEPRFAATVGFPLFPRRVFEEQGLFRPLAFAQDNDFHAHLAKAGYRFLQVPGIVATYRTRASARSAIGQKWRNGLWVGRLAPGPTGPGRLIHTVPFFYVASLITLTAAGLVAPALWGLAAGIGALHTAACAAVAALRCGRAEAASIPRTFVLLLGFHYAYGTGFLAGLLTYRRCVSIPRPTLP